MTDSTTSRRMVSMQALLQEQSLDVALVTNPVNIRYLTGFTGSAGVLLIMEDKAALYVDGRYTQQAQKQVPKSIKTIGSPRPVLNFALEQLPQSIDRLGIEANFLTVAEKEHLQTLLPALTQGLVPLNRAVETLRAVKDKTELAAIQQAVDISDKVFTDFCEWVQPGMIENEVAARLEYEQRLAGGERNASGMTIVASGPRSSLPHGIASNRVIGKNEAVMIDIGTTVDGYCSDLTRTIFLGPAPESFKALYRLVQAAQESVFQSLRPGLTGIEADKLARDVIVQGGYPDNFDHSLAHALGLEVHERPLLNPRDSSLIQENMVFTIEPGVYLEGQFGVRIEDVVCMTAGGCKVMSQSSRALLEL